MIVDQSRVRSIVEGLTDDDKVDFISGMVDVLTRSIVVGDEDVLEWYLSDWEDVVELNFIPGLRENVLRSYQALVDSGKIEGPKVH